MNGFKVGNEVRFKESSKVLETRLNIDMICLKHFGWVRSDLFELVPLEPVYQNEPHPHCDMICHVAKGGEVRNIESGYLINNVGQKCWQTSSEYEIVYPPTKNELRIEHMKKEISIHQGRIDHYNEKLKELTL